MQSNLVSPISLINDVLPDIASKKTNIEGKLDSVGMCGIDLPITLQMRHNKTHTVAAKLDVAVNLLDPEARGIHMSRLYRLVVDASDTTMSCKNLPALLFALLESHQTLSDRVEIRFAFAYLLQRPALVSGLVGWKSYPSAIIAKLEQGQIRIDIQTEVLYSSTCPASAALARDARAQAFSENFATLNLDRDKVTAWLRGEAGQVASAHAQRSAAKVSIEVKRTVNHFPFDELIDAIELALPTQVQTAVKRADEQAFAKLNGTNLMFCEDAARRVAKQIRALDFIASFDAELKHFESLHAHDAVARVRG